jgi:hypothetical protein
MQMMRWGATRIVVQSPPSAETTRHLQNSLGQLFVAALHVTGCTYVLQEAMPSATMAATTSFMPTKEQAAHQLFAARRNIKQLHG